jgi:hypothetical protein
MPAEHPRRARLFELHGHGLIRSRSRHWRPSPRQHRSVVRSHSRPLGGGSRPHTAPLAQPAVELGAAGDQR